MAKGTSKYIIAVWLALALVGQALGSVLVSCPGLQPEGSETGSGPGDHSMYGMDHSHHAEDATPVKSFPIDCCGDAQCPMLHCVSSPSMSVGSDLNSSAIAPPAFGPGHPLAYSSAPPDSHYHPPKYR
jgi:hypothetical protein